MIHNRLSKLTRVALFAAVLALIPVSAWAYETVTGSQSISVSAGTQTLNPYQVGTKDEAGYLTITGTGANTDLSTNNLNFNSNTEIEIPGFRATTGYKAATGEEKVTYYQIAGLNVVNGTVEISNATVATTGSLTGTYYNASRTATSVKNDSSVYLNAPEGCSANIVLNSGAKLISNGYPTIGGQYGTSGTITVNEGATLFTPSSFYVSGHGEGTLNINNGTVQMTKGLQIARDYEGMGNSQGTVNMTGGTLTIGSYFIMNLNSKADSPYINTAIFNQTGGTTTVGSYFCIGNANSAYVDKIEGYANIGGGTGIAKLTVGTNFNIGNGESSTSIEAARAAKGVMNVYKNADVTVGNNVTSAFFGIGSKAALNMYGGSMLSKGASGLTNAGKINLQDGTLTITNAVTNNSGAEIKVAHGTFNAKSTVTNAGTITITPSLDGWGKMAITGAYSGTGKISVGLDHGLGLFSTLCGTVNDVLTAASGLNAVTNSILFSVTKTDTKISAKANTEAAVQMKLGDTLAVISPLGMAKVTGFEGNSAITFDVKNGDKALTAQETSDLVDWLNESDVLGDALTVSGAEGLITLSGLSGIKDGSYFAFDLGSYNTAYTVGTIGSSAVPEPATWALLLLGLGALAVVRRKR